MAIQQYLSNIAEIVLTNVTVLVTGSKVQYLWNASFEADLEKALSELYNAGWNTALENQAAGKLKKTDKTVKE